MTFLRTYGLTVVLFAVNLLLVPVLFYAVSVGLPWWAAIIIQAVWAWLMLPGATWRDYQAAMNVKRVKEGCEVELPPADQRCLEPDHERLIRWQLALPGAVRNWVFNHTWGALHFRRFGHWRDRGFTDRINRYRLSGDARLADWTNRVSARWMDRGDPRGRHT